jgi:transcriptional regulator with XRE-family HTH domain
MSTTTAIFGRRLRILRERAGLSQTQLAARCNFEQSHISRWERGGAEPRFESLVQLADALGVPLDDFREEKKSRNPVKSH